jgi:hypothetical protein
MRIFFGGPAVGGPACVANAIGAFKGLIAKDFFKILQLAGGAANLQQCAAAAYGDAGRVIAAVFEPAKTLNDDGNDLFLAYVSDDSTHVLVPM